MLKKIVFILIFVFINTNLVIANTLPWPTTSYPQYYDIDAFKSEGASGIVFDPHSNMLFVVDDGGRVARMSQSGYVINFKKIKRSLGGTAFSGSKQTTAQDDPKGLFGSGEDVEAIATKDQFYLYAGLENRKDDYYDYRDGQWHDKKIPQIWQISTSSLLTTGREWFLDMPTSSGKGMEGLTWVPNGKHVYGNRSSGGVFFASSQSNGRIYVYDIDTFGTSIATPFTLEPAIASFAPTLPGFVPYSQRSDISGLHFDPSQDLLYVLYDSANLLVLIDTSSPNYNVMETFRLPLSSAGKSDEGITVLPRCGISGNTTLYLLDDKSTDDKVGVFNNFPVICGMGVPNDSEFFSQTVPTYMTGGESYWVTVAFKNTGSTNWTGGDFTIGEQPDNNSYTWGISTVNFNGTIGPNKVGHFSFQVVAPTQSGVYHFQWRMKDGQDWFGEKSAAMTIEVFGECVNNINCIIEF